MFEKNLNGVKISKFDKNLSHQMLDLKIDISCNTIGSCKADGSDD